MPASQLTIKKVNLPSDTHQSHVIGGRVMGTDGKMLQETTSISHQKYTKHPPDQHDTSQGGKDNKPPNCKTNRHTVNGKHHCETSTKMVGKNRKNGGNSIIY